jgi:hypothetical protein
MAGNISNCHHQTRAIPGRAVTAARGPARLRGEDGFAGTVVGVLIGFIVLLAGTLLVAHAWGVVDTKSATTEAARAAARSYVEAPDSIAATSDATIAADLVLQGLGRDPARAGISVVSGSFSRCDRITIAVTYPAPVVSLPLVGRIGAAESVRSMHSELVDPYRSGLPGTASCG